MSVIVYQDVRESLSKKNRKRVASDATILLYDKISIFTGSAFQDLDYDSNYFVRDEKFAEKGNPGQPPNSYVVAKLIGKGHPGPTDVLETFITSVNLVQGNTLWFELTKPERQSA